MTADAAPAPRILVADDDDMIRGVLAETLMAHGAVVETRDNGQEALCAAMSMPFDVCILDIEMPVMTGLEACERLREAAFTKNLPILFLTGRSDAETVNQAFSSGAWDYLNKPIHPVLLWQRVSNLLLLSKLVKERDSLNALMNESATVSAEDE